MTIIEHGKMRDGAIAFPRPLNLPEGVEVVVKIETLSEDLRGADSITDIDFASLPFFGMWGDREEMNDSVGWGRREREQWQERMFRRD
jgi:hypothetical protein